MNATKPFKTLTNDWLAALIFDDGFGAAANRWRVVFQDTDADETIEVRTFASAERAERAAEEFVWIRSDDGPPSGEVWIMNAPNNCDGCARGLPIRDGSHCLPNGKPEQRCVPDGLPPHRFYYVSAIDGPKRYLIAGPYPDHAAALAKVDTVRTEADKLDPRAWFMAWGTAGADEEIKTPMGLV